MNPEMQLLSLYAQQHSLVRQACYSPRSKTLYHERMSGLSAYSHDSEAPLHYSVLGHPPLLSLDIADTTPAAMGGTYAFVSTASANLRQKNDPYNPGLGGFFAGALVGLRSALTLQIKTVVSVTDSGGTDRSMPSVLGNGVLLGVALAGAQYTGGAVFSQRSDPDEDKFVTKEEIRRRFRRPANEMINEIGEGRGTSAIT